MTLMKSDLPPSSLTEFSLLYCVIVRCLSHYFRGLLLYLFLYVHVCLVVGSPDLNPALELQLASAE